MAWEKYIEELSQQEYSAEEEQNIVFTDVDKQAALDAWNKDLDVYINRIRVNDIDEIMNATGGFSLSNFQLEAQKEIEKQDLKTSYVLGNIGLDDNKLDFSKVEVERYGVTSQECYTLHPEHDVLEEIFNRINTIEITSSANGYDTQLEDLEANNGTYEIYAEMNEDKSDADLRISFLDQNVDVSVPISDNEKNELCETIINYEEVREQKKAEEKEPEKANKENEVKCWIRNDRD